MYHKALTFSDTKAADEILRTADPKKCKALGQQVKNFTDEVWDEVKLQIVEQGSYLKFTSRGDTLKNKLLATGERELVEAAQRDRVWGVGFSAKELRMGKIRREDLGENLLGKALMTARQRIRDEDERKRRVDEEESGLLKGKTEESIRKPK